MHVLGLLIYTILKVFITSDCNLMPEFLYTIVAFFFRPACSQQQQQQQVCHKIFIDKTPSCCCCCWVFFGPKANQARPKKRKLVATLQSAIHKLVCGQCTTQRCAVKKLSMEEDRSNIASTVPCYSGNARRADAL